MAEQCNKNSIATSSSAAKWWQDVHASSICSWTGDASYASNPPCNNSHKRSSNCSNGEDVSITTSFTTNASNNSGLSMESSRQLVEKTSANDPYGEAVSDNHHLWNQVLLDVGTTGELQNIPTRMFEPACNYLKKIESGLEFSSPANINQFQKNFNGFKDGSCLNKPSSESNMSNKCMLNTMNLPDRRKPDQLLNSYQPVRPRGSTLTKISGRGNGVINEGKKRKSEDQSGSLLKKTKLETSTVSSTKVQIPKAKLGDKITALQQIVSPFGKTDTASVLFEAIGYIKCLQEQVQLLSNPYLKTNIIKDSWVRFETKDRGDMKLDLKSGGLCLVPVSCTPQVYHENNGTDYYWTPTYRGCFYR
ncbi:hypothetical protein L1987_38927 [Smallanthus sonchifolius]|uniref:Uncharacterized protein n=1 Tax=Smallanthus sonchifolius TaxID=185202 RepID=A0ACB9HKK1_9ASTR|nr:hypothetical protein L1987_38927 [Smallanthus sonchifolius]